MKKYNIINFLILSINNFYNSSFSTLLIFGFIFLKDYMQASCIALLGSFCILATKSLSSNLRNILIINQFKINFYIFFRFIFSYIIFFFSFIFIFYFLKFNYILIFFSLILCSQWVNELILVQFEIKKNFFLSYIQFSTNSLFIILFFFSWYNSLDKKFILLILILYCCYLNLYPIRIFFSFLNKTSFKKFKKELIIIFSTNSFFSSFSLNFVNFFWRTIIFYLVETNISSIIFAFYAIGSFPGTLFNNSFGPSMIKKSFNTNYLFLFFFIYLVAVFLFFFFIFKDFIAFSYYLKSPDFFFYNLLFFSLIGSIIMLFAQYFRQKTINQSPKLNNSVFKKDIILSSVLLIIVPLLYLVGSVNYLAYSFFCSAIMSFMAYYKKH